MRGDDRSILEEIQSFFSCGLIHIHKPVRTRPLGHPGARLIFSRTPELIELIIPHFERGPLRAKKARDFAIWREAVQLLHRVATRPEKVYRAGRVVTWSDKDKADFDVLFLAIKDGRVFDAAPVPVPPPRPSNGQGRLFE